jgi:16S rRNA (cytosine1402-N4)-methyltransferase
MQIPHKPVLLKESVDMFKGISNGYFIDCTLGFGGHSEAILNAYPNIKLIGIDQDKEALEFAKKRLSKFKNRVEFINKRASLALKELKGVNVSGILADIGVSSYQLDNKERGFAFDSKRLDMRMNQDQDLSAYDVVNFYSKEDLEKIFKTYAEERKYKKIADIIVKNRPIVSNKELSEVLLKAGIKNTKNLARIFQAIRIEVNAELKELENLLENAKNIAKKNTILAIITFHSLEDRIVKNSFKNWSKKCICPPEAIKCECGGNNQIGEIINKKPIVASEDEIRENPRSRSAKLRGFCFSTSK